MDGFSELQQELKDLNVSIVAASSDAQDKAVTSEEKYGFPIGYGIDEAMIKSLGGYWEDQRLFSQPSEFLVNPEGKIAQLSYSDGPLGRMEASDVIKSVNFMESQKNK